MADNKQAGAAVGSGPTFATDEIGGVDYPRTKIVWGVDGTATDASASNPLPVVQTGTPALPTGAATSAKQDTEITALQAIQTAVQGTLTVTGGGGGTEYTEDAAAAANPVGTALILVREDARAGSLTSTDGDNVALRGNNKGEAYVKDTDAGVSLASIDGKITAVNTGAVVVSSSALPSGAATSAKQDTQITHLSTLAGAVAGTEMQVDVLTLPNVTLAAGTNTNEVVGDVAHDAAIAGNPLTMGGVASAAAPTDVSADQDAVRAWFLRNGAQAVNLTAAGALIPGDATNGLKVQVATALPAGTNAIGKLAANSGVDIGDVDVTSVPTDPFGANADAASATGSISAKLRFIAATGIPITGTVTVGSHAVTNAGTFAVQDSEKIADNAAFTDGTTKINPVGFIYDEVAGTALTENDIGAARMDAKRAITFTLEDGTTRAQRQAVNAGGAAEIHGDVAHDAAISGNPVRIAGRAVSSDYTAVATGDTADLITDLNGKQIVLPYSIPENFLDGTTAAITGTSDTAVIAAQGASVRIYVTGLIVTNSHATVGTVVEIKDGTTVKFRQYAAPAGGGFTWNLPSPLRLTANTALNAANVTTGSNTYVSAVGYKAP